MSRNVKKWWKEEVAYQIYPRSFYDSNNDGIGDIRGIIEKLDYLKNLGISILWICPIFKSPMDDNGYDVSDYYDINPEFGTKEDLEELIDKAKEKGIKILLDLVINHTSDEHDWFQEALKDPNSKYRDYYIFKRGKNGLPPTNWRSHFGGSAWEVVKGETDENGDEMYYLHLFSKKQPDLNWENPVVREELYKIVNYWLEKGIAGYRVDAINSIKKDQRYLSLPVDAPDGLAFNTPYTLNQHGIEEFLSELKENTFAKYDCMTVAETPELEYERFEAFIGENGFFSMTFDFNYVDLDMSGDGFYYNRKDVDIEQFREILFESQEVLEKYGWGAPFLENHDQPRSLDKYFGEKANIKTAKLLANLFFFLKGTPFIYQGQEIGMNNFERSSIDEFDDLASKDQYKRGLINGLSEEESLYYVNRRSRDNSRTPMQWDSSENAGFSPDKSQIPWIKLTGSQKKINVEAEEKDSNSILSHYKKMIELRQNSEYRECLIYGKFVGLDLNVKNVIGYLRKDDNYTIACINNFNDTDVEIEFPFEIKIEKVLLNNYRDNSIDELANGKKIVLKEYQSILLLLK